MPFRAFLLLAVICFAWAFNVIVSKLAVGTLHMPPIAYAAARALIVTALLLPWLRPIPARLPRVMAVGLALSGGSFALLFIGLRFASPAASAVVNLASAPLTVLFAILFLKEQVRWRRGIGIALTFGGVLIALAAPGAAEASFGLIFVGLSAAVGSLGAVLLKQLDIAPLRMQAWAGVSSLIVLTPLSLLTESGTWQAVRAGGPELGVALFYSAVIVSLAAHTGYFRMLQAYDANLLAPLTLMTPMMTIGLGAALTGDHVGPQLVVGAGLAVVGVLVILVRPSRNVFKPLLVRARL